jgi:hypothetical protein
VTPGLNLAPPLHRLPRRQCRLAPPPHVLCCLPRVAAAGW